MPLLYTRTTNAMFDDRDEGGDHPHAEAALALGVIGAIGIVADEVRRGERCASVVVSIEQADGTPVLRSVVSVSISPLLSPPAAPPATRD